MNSGEILTELLINLQCIFRDNIKFQGASYQQIISLLSIEMNGMEMSSFASKVGVDKSTATRMINGLEKKGWVLRKKNNKDKRISIVLLSSEGMQLQNKLEIQIEQLGEKIEDNLGLNDKENIIEKSEYLNWALVKIKNIKTLIV